MKRILILCCLLCTMSIGLYAQGVGGGVATLPSESFSFKNPVIGVKSNLLYDATTTFNLGLEIGLSRKWTLELPVNYNPWTFSGGKKIKDVMVQPEGRYWLCERFNGHFFGVHAHYGVYNAGGIDLPFNMFPGFKESRYEGYLVGGGVSYGYQWMLGNHWNIEATVGVGYAYLDYDKYRCGNCGEFIRKGKDNYFGPTKIGLSIIYLIK